MAQTGAVIFLPREEGQTSRMLEELLFDPAALWLAQALEDAGTDRFFVVCHGEDQAKAELCFPEGTRFVTNGSADAVEQLTGFLQELEGKADQWRAHCDVMVRNNADLDGYVDQLEHDYDLKQHARTIASAGTPAVEQLVQEAEAYLRDLP